MHHSKLTSEDEGNLLPGSQQDPRTSTLRAQNLLDQSGIPQGRAEHRPALRNK